MVHRGRHGAPLTAPPHTTVSQYVGGLMFAAAPAVWHHGVCRTTVAAMLDGSVF
jgi:hypothetical protein